MGLTVAELEQEVVSQGAAQTGLLAEVADARGTARTLGARLDVALNPDGTLRSPVATVSFVTEIAPIISYPPTGDYVALEGDLTDVYVAKRRLRINGALLPYVTSSTYDAGGDYTVVNFSTPVGNSITSVEYSFDPAAMPPLHYSGNPDIEQVVSGISTFATKHLSDAQYKSLLDDILARVTITSLASVDDGAGVDLVGRAFKYVDTIDDLRTLTSTDAPVYVQCHTIPGDGGHGTFRWDATSTATDDNGVTIAVTGVDVGRWIRQFNGYVKVEMFGCFVGAADNSPAFQKILDSGITEIQFGVGQYDFGSGFVLSTPITVIGAGSKALDYPTYGTILRHTGDDDFFFFNLPSTTRGGSFRDLKIQSTSKTNNVFRFNNCWRFRLEHLDINGGGYSIYAEGLTFAIIAESCKIQLYEIAGYFGDGTTTDAKILNCDIAPTVGSTAWGIINKGNETLVSGCWFECGPGDRAVGAGGHIYQPADSPNIASIKIVNNNLGRTGVNGGNHVRIEGGLTAAISGNSFAGGSTPDAPLIYIDTLTGSEGLYHCKIQGNKFTNIIQEAIYVNNGYVTINGNSFHVNTDIFTADNIIKDIYSATSSLIVSDNYFTSSASTSKCAIAGSATFPVVKECNNNVVFNMGLSSGYVETAIGNRIHGGTAKTAQGLSVRSGNVIGNFFKNLAVGLVARACVVNSNTFETCTTPITPYTADGVNPKIEGNQGDTQELTTSGTLPTRWGITTVNTSSGAFSGTLGSGYRIGDFKAFVVTSHSGNYTLTVSSLEGASKTCTFTSTSSTLLLMWDGSTWVNIKAVDVTIS